MKTKITVGAALLLTLGSAVAGGGMIYQNDRAMSRSDGYTNAASSADISEVTPEMITKWKATAATSDYSPAMLPI